MNNACVFSKIDTFPWRTNLLLTSLLVSICVVAMWVKHAYQVPSTDYFPRTHTHTVYFGSTSVCLIISNFVFVSVDFSVVFSEIRFWYIGLRLIWNITVLIMFTST